MQALVGISILCHSLSHTTFLVVSRCTVKSFDPTTSTVTLVGRHSKADASPSSPQANAVSCLVALNDSTVVSASWNGQLMVWDLNNTTTDPLAVLDLPGKAFGMDVHTEGQVLVATAGRRICVVDCATPSSPKLVENRESSLKFQTRCIASFGARNGFAIGSVEGRVGVEFLSTSSGKKFAFKCHRVNDTVHPVNCIQFHPKFPDTFATGGCDGTVVLWDGGNKKKVSVWKEFSSCAIVRCKQQSHLSCCCS